MPIADISKVWIERTYTPPACLSAVARSNKLYIDVTIDNLVGVQRSAIVRLLTSCSIHWAFNRTLHVIRCCLSVCRLFAFVSFANRLVRMFVSSYKLEIFIFIWMHDKFIKCNWKCVAYSTKPILAIYMRTRPETWDQRRVHTIWSPGVICHGHLTSLICCAM